MYRSALELTLLLQYGPYINAAKTADLLSYPSYAALSTARQRGRLPIPMSKLSGRHGWFAKTTDVAHWIESIDQEPDSARGASA